MVVESARLEYHPAACLFPEFSLEEYADLREDIAEYGQRVSIKILDGMVLDGRAVLRACQELNIEPKFETVTLAEIGDPFEYVFSLNLQRRHLTASQRAQMAHNAREISNSPVSRIAARFDVSPRYVDMAAEVSRNGVDELPQAVVSGQVSLPTAREISRLPKQEQQTAVQRISSGETVKVRRESPKATPVKQRATDGRPAKVVDLKTVFLDAFDNLDGCRFECLIAAFNQLSEGEQAVFAERIGAIVSPQSVSEFKPLELDVSPIETEPQVETLPVDRETLTDELINSDAMVELGAMLDPVNESRAVAIGVVRLLYAYTAESTPAGDIGTKSDSLIAKACGWPASDSTTLIAALLSTGWLLRDTSCRMVVADWENRCPSSVLRQMEEDGLSFVEHNAPPDFALENCVPDPKASKRRAPKRIKYSEAFERFWAAYPTTRKMKKPLAFEAWQKALRIASPPDDTPVDEWLIQRVQQYANSHQGKSEFCPMPSVWLNGGKWDDADASWAKFKDPEDKNSVAVRRPMPRLGAYMKSQNQ